MKRSKKIFKLVGDVFWKNIHIKPFGENTSNNKNVENDLPPDIQNYFTNTNFTTKSLDNDGKETVYDIFKNVGFYDFIPNKGINSTKMQDGMKYLAKVIQKNPNPLLLLPSSEETSDNDSDNVLEGRGHKKTSYSI